jgi:restriction endonuclease Mrr
VTLEIAHLSAESRVACRLPIPSINELMRPVLDAYLNRDRVQSEDLVRALAPSFALSSEESEERQPSGDLVFLQPINWTRTFLGAARLSRETSAWRY